MAVLMIWMHQRTCFQILQTQLHKCRITVSLIRKKLVMEREINNIK
uniref:Uncharacterized protein n=1 Tax=Arundo donax TaxID=35708 RepID=A0A0A9ALX9_ARUDO